MKTTKEKLSRWLGPEQWLLRIGLAVAGAAALATYGVLAGWRDGLSSLLTSKLPPQLLLDTVWLLLLGLLLMVLSWWFYYRSLQPQEEAIALFLSMQSWSEVPGTRQQLVLSYAQAETVVRSLRPTALEEFQERGFVFQISQHSEDDDGAFDARRFFR